MDALKHLEKKKDTYDADFFIEHPYFRLVITMHTRNRFLRTVFNSMRRATKLTQKLSDVNEITVDMKYYKLIKTTMQKIIEDEIKTAAEKGVYVKTAEIGNAQFIRKKDDPNIWNIELTVMGEYRGVEA